MKLYRIADTRHEIWGGTGAMLVGGRINSPGRPVIYAALTFAGAMLELLVHASARCRRPMPGSRSLFPTTSKSNATGWMPSPKAGMHLQFALAEILAMRGCRKCALRFCWYPQLSRERNSMRSSIPFVPMRHGSSSLHRLQWNGTNVCSQGQTERCRELYDIHLTTQMRVTRRNRHMKKPPVHAGGGGEVER